MEAIEEALELTVERVLGPRWQRREDKRVSPSLCHHCSSRLLSSMRRNGHYQRNLAVGEGVITLWVPQVECKGCGKSVSVERSILAGPPAWQVPGHAGISGPGSAALATGSDWTER